VNKIAFPLQLGMQGPTVAELQEALQVCMDRGALLAGNPTQRQQFSSLLKPQRAAQCYGETISLVATFQGEQHVQASTTVDEHTANAIGVHIPPEPSWNLHPNTGDVIAYPTPASTFSSMDFCACEHRRSILSRAAALTVTCHKLIPESAQQHSTLSSAMLAKW
jgi:hypothetical protein